MKWTASYCDKAVSPQCPGHEGWEKFPDCLSRALYHAPDESTGSVDWDYWVGLVIQEQTETLDSDTCPVTVAAGTYMTIAENDHGNITIRTYDTAHEAQAAFDESDIAYGEWLSGQDEREWHVMTSTGLSFAAIDGVH